MHLMTNPSVSMNQPRDIYQRTRTYAVRSIHLCQAVQEIRGVGEVISKQFLRSATSIGANIAEAQSSESRPDFIHKYSIAQKEARESLYWLMLLAEAKIVSLHKLQPMMDETNELLAIIASIIIKAKKPSDQKESPPQ